MMRDAIGKSPVWIFGFSDERPPSSTVVRGVATQQPPSDRSAKRFCPRVRDRERRVRLLVKR